MIKKILLLGDPGLYMKCSPVEEDELAEVSKTITDLHDTLLNYRMKHNAGRAIAAPQIGYMKRLVYMFIETPTIFINPEIEYIGDETMTVLDDCMSFPNLLVEVQRYRSIRITYRDLDWMEQQINLSGDLSELLQHEYDHLDGILATMRAIGSKAFYLKTSESGSD